MNNTYAKAYTEVLEILKYLPKDDYAKIPEEKIIFFEKNRDNDYEYKLDENLPLSEQKISREANAIIISIFRDFFASKEQRIKLQKILLANEFKRQARIEKYANF